MNRKYVMMIMLVGLIALTAVSAHDNVSDMDVASSYDEDTLEKSYFYDSETGEEYEDDTVVTHNVVKYYGDTDTKFRVKVYDDDYYPESGVYVSFGKYGHMKEKRTNGNGVVYFAINYKVGTHDVETYIQSNDGSSYWSAYNTVKIKSTIPTSELVKFSGSKKKFKIKFLDTKGHVLKGTLVKVKIKGKYYGIKTDSHGFAKIKSKHFKVGKTKITAYNPNSKEYRKISVVILKKGIHKVSIRVDDPTFYFPQKRLKNGDTVSTVYSTKYGQYYPGVYVEARMGGQESCKHTKLIKAKFFFKNKKTGKVITKTSSKVKYASIKVNPVSGYSPYKAIVWYRDK